MEQMNKKIRLKNLVQGLYKGSKDGDNQVVTDEKKIKIIFSPYKMIVNG